MTIEFPIIAGAGWIFVVFAGLAIIMIVKWFIDILP